MCFVFHRQSIKKIIHTMMVSRQTANDHVTHSCIFNNKEVNFDYRNSNELN